MTITIYFKIMILVHLKTRKKIRKNLTMMIYDTIQIKDILTYITKYII